MKTIGMIGGVSWQATIEYYRIINEQIEKKLGGHHSANIVMTCVDFDPLVKYCHLEEWEKIGQIFEIEAQKLEKAGADFFIMCANTMHKLADKLSRSVDIPLLHIVEVTAQAIKKQNFKKVGLLGTKITMESDFYLRDMAKHDIEVIIPDEDDRNTVHQIIYDELVHGTISNVSRNKYLRIIDSLIKKGALGVVLGCTEIPLLIKQEHVSVPIFDTTRIHAEAAARLSLMGISKNRLCHPER